MLDAQPHACCSSTTPTLEAQWADSLYLLTYSLAFMLLLEPCLQEFQPPESSGCFMPWIMSPEMSLQLQSQEAFTCTLEQNWIFHLQTLLSPVFNQVVQLTKKKREWWWVNAMLRIQGKQNIEAVKEWWWVRQIYTVCPNKPCSCRLTGHIHAS